MIGPGYPNNLQSEVFTLPSFTSSSCVPPIFPHDDYHGYVGTNTPDGPLLCGGTHSGRRQSACYLLDKKGVWVTVGHQMSSRRFGAASVQTERVWWVTGQFGQFGGSHKFPSGGHDMGQGNVREGFCLHMA